MFIRRTLRWMIAAIFLLTLVVMPAVAQEDEAPRLRVGKVGDLVSLEPYRAAEANYLFLETVFDQILFNERAQGVGPEAAVSWEMSDDNTSITFVLREGMVTHDGSPVNAEMVVWNVENRVTNAERGAALYTEFAPWYESVEALDELTVRINFNGPTPHAPDLLALLAITDPDMFIRDDGTEALANQQDKQIGSGPFVLVEYVPGSHIRYDRFDDYWEEGVPAISGIDVIIYGDAASMVAALEAGEVDYIFNPPFEDAARLMNNPNFTVHVPQTQGVSYIVMVNPEREQLNDVRVRQAINNAIDREAINIAAFAGLAIPTSICFPPNSLAYNADHELGITPNVETAQALIAEAGAEGINVGITVPGNNPTLVTIAEILVANLQEIGINAVIDVVESNIWTQRRTSQDFDMLVSIIAGTNKHPAGMTNSFVYRPVNNPFFDAIEPQQEYLDFQDAFDRGMRATTEEEAREAWQAASLALIQGAWSDCLVGAPFLGISSAAVNGLTWTEADKPVFKYVTIDR